MTKKERELLVKDLRGRIGYNVKVLHESWNYEWDQELSLVERVVGIDDDFVYVRVIDTYTGEEYRENKHSIELYECKPYLRPMSSITEEEIRDFPFPYYFEWIDSSFSLLCSNDKVCASIGFDEMYEIMDWLNKRHFDYRGLIEKGLALEAPKGMYEY